MPPKKAIPTGHKHPREKGDRRAEALSRLQIKYQENSENDEPRNLLNDLDGQPIVTPILKQAEGGTASVLDALRAYEDEDAQEFIALHDSLTKTDRKFLSLEEIAVASGIGSARLLELSTSAMLNYGQSSVKIFLAASMHKVVHAAVKAASTGTPIIDDKGNPVRDDKGNLLLAGYGDIRAMELVGKMTGLVPTPKGAHIAIQNNVGEKAESAPAGYFDPGEHLRSIRNITDPMRLPAPPHEPVMEGTLIANMQQNVAHILSEGEDNV
jgi:hypothetical protein